MNGAQLSCAQAARNAPRGVREWSRTFDLVAALRPSETNSAIGGNRGRGVAAPGVRKSSSTMFGNGCAAASSVRERCASASGPTVEDGGRAVSHRGDREGASSGSRTFSNGAAATSVRCSNCRPDSFAERIVRAVGTQAARASGVGSGSVRDHRCETRCHRSAAAGAARAPAAEIGLHGTLPPGRSSGARRRVGSSERHRGGFLHDRIGYRETGRRVEPAATPLGTIRRETLGYAPRVGVAAERLQLSTAPGEVVRIGDRARGTDARRLGSASGGHLDHLRGARRARGRSAPPARSSGAVLRGREHCTSCVAAACRRPSGSSPFVE